MHQRHLHLDRLLNIGTKLFSSLHKTMWTPLCKADIFRLFKFPFRWKMSSTTFNLESFINFKIKLYSSEAKTNTNFYRITKKKKNLDLRCDFAVAKTSSVSWMRSQLRWSATILMRLSGRSASFRGHRRTDQMSRNVGRAAGRNLVVWSVLERDCETSSQVVGSESDTLRGHARCTYAKPESSWQWQPW